MLQIALETSTRSPSICLMEGADIIGLYEIGANEPTTAALLPAIKRLLDDAETEATAVDLVSISLGPGSFTGLRMGVAVAKTFAWSVGCQVFATGTHRVIACQVARDSQSRREVIGQVATVIDAQRGQWFVHLHNVSANGVVDLERDPGEHSIVDPQEFLDSLTGSDSPVDPDAAIVVCGPALTRMQQKWTIPANLCLADSGLWKPNAKTVGWIAANHPDLGRMVDPFELAPAYGRKSAAEEKYDQRTKSTESETRS